MGQVKVIVQGIPSDHNDCKYPEHCEIQDRIILEQLFATYGPAKVVYLLADEIAHSSLKHREVRDIVAPKCREVRDNFAHVIFENAQDSVKACLAADNHEIKFKNSILTVTQMSESSIPIDILDDDSLMKIFSLLTIKERLRIEQVCHHWKKVVQYSWSNVRLLDLHSDKNIGEKFGIQLQKFGKYLEEIHFSTACPILYELIPAHCGGLKHLKLSLCNRSESPSQNCISRMLRGLNNLITFGFLQHSMPPRSVGLDFIGSLSETIEVIILFAQWIRPSCELSRFRCLKALYISGYDVIEGIENMQMLTVLSLSWPSSDQSSQATIEPIQYLTKLEALGIGESGIDDNILIKILTNNRDLRQLNISGITSLTDRSMNVVSTLPKLESLDLSGLNVTLMFMDKMPSLKRLSCKKCGNVMNKGLERLIKLTPNLQFLDLKGTLITSDFFEIVNSCVKNRQKAVLLEIETSVPPEIWNNMELSPLLKITDKSRDWFYRI